ncbi:uncharacterized protein J8A68_004939 [[Candida] subhashii]|uniref:DUF4484 domain-containing protein n=1 Tax=[Candida] subhashii TaxID=561895 RepID=A0A8J5QPK8_9ASCO|nr:uncharacterized protein J8A68_004939 [[Candida] subhashii]KAG7661570.1 hypothetical protein J8A68_004939 [[Candida] subhashii]
MSYTPSNVIALFLTEFDVKSGYKLIWTKSTIPSFDFSGLDYKVLPSGIHEYNQSTVLISHKFDNQLYYGLSRFRQYIIGDDSDDRNNVKMYSLGLLCDPGSSGSGGSSGRWKPNEFINNGWEFVDVLDRKLLKYIQGMKYNEVDIFEKLFDELTNSNNLLNVPGSSGIPNVNNHLLTKLPQLFKTLGPLVFVLYKQSLLRRKILFFNQHHIFKDNQDLLPDDEYDSLLNVSAFCYLISLLSIIPKDIETVANTNTLTYSQPIYNIGLHDLSDNELLTQQATIATTNDDILKNHNIYDIGVMIDDKVSIFPQQHSNDIEQYKIRATTRDYHKFKLIYQDLPLTNKKFKFTNHTNISTDDLNSITTTNSSTIRDFGDSLLVKPDHPMGEPTWWKTDAIEPISWRESIWSAFSWFATAGYQTDESLSGTTTATAGDKLSLIDEDPRHTSLDKVDLLDLINIVGYFHKLTKKWFYLINEIVLEVLEEQVPQGETIEENTLLTSVGIELTYQDIVDMELDPYSQQDLDFVKEFVLLYWGAIVDEVEIGIGLNSICC